MAIMRTVSMSQRAKLDVECSRISVTSATSSCGV